MARAAHADTRTRVLAAATALFSRQGFHATTVRDIAARARVNVASGHYHFGSKKTLYLEVLRQQFATIQQTLAARTGDTSPAALGRRSPPQLEALFRTRVATMLELMIGPDAPPHAALMQREMTDPSEALATVVREFVEPMLADMAVLLAHLAPALPPAAIERCCLSVMSQALFYFNARAGLLHMWGLRAYPPGFVAQLTDHIVGFSLAGLRGVSSAAARRSHAGR